MSSWNRVRAAASLGALVLLVACGGGSDNSDSAPPPPPPLSGPTAAFAVAASGSVLTPLALDASASTSADGSALQYVWDFGGGQRGGGQTIAHVFGSGGSKNVTLTVIDGAGKSASLTKTVTIAAAAAAATTVTAQGVVKAVDGTVIAGVTVSAVGSTASAITDALGTASLSLGTGTPVTLKFSKGGYADQFLPLALPATTGADAAFEVAMRPRDAAQTLADAATGGTLSGRDGALITLPANALVNAAGTAVTGPVQIAMTPVDVTQAGAGGFPGSFDGVKPDGTMSPIVSLGVNEYVLTAGGQPLQLAPGKTATIEVPIYGAKRLDGSIVAVGDSTPLWSLDESTGVWVQEGVGTVVASAASPSGLAMRATVTHFSWWNCDLGYPPFGPEPQCVYDTDSGVPGGNDLFASATICNMLSEIDRGSAVAAATSRAHIEAAPIPPQYVGFSRRNTVAIAGGQPIAVPPDINVRLTARALNGTWGGEAVVNGAAFVLTPVIIKMRPLFALSGPSSEAITLPFDATRTLPDAPATPESLFTFTGTAQKFVQVTVTTGGGGFSGRLRLLQGSTVLSTVPFQGAGQFTVPLPATGTYTIDVIGDLAGPFRLQAVLLGSVQDESVSVPTDLTRSIPSFTTYHANLNLATPTALYLAARPAVNSAAMTMRLLGSDGTVLFAPTTSGGVTSSTSLQLAAGSYVFEVQPLTASTSNFELTLETTSWLQVAPGLDATGAFQVVDLVADRTGKPVVGYVNPVAHDGRSSNVLMLRRWTGSAWETVGTDLTIDRPCESGGPEASFAFDSANNPTVAYANTTATGTSFVTSRRFSGGAWQALGANDGMLPATSQFTSACLTLPIVAIGADDAPQLAYRADNNVVVQRFDGVAWKGLATAAGDVFALQNNTYDLKVDAAGRSWFVTDAPTFSGTPALVRRFNATTLAWDIVGGSLPQIGTLGLSTPRLRFDGSGNPVIGWVASVGSGSVASPGTAVYRFDGSTWSTTGGYQTGPDNFLETGVDDFGFALFAGDALASWTNATRSTSSSTVVVQRNTPAGWSAFGPGMGEIPQLTPHGITDVSASSSRLLAIGGELYLVATAAILDGSNTVKITLMRRAGG
jgi:hypothetical protein